MIPKAVPSPVLTWKIYGCLVPEPEYQFHPYRKWRFDWAWPVLHIAVEVEGGVWSRGRHTRGSGFLADCAKYNMAAKMGWRVFRFTPEQMRKGEAQAFMKEILDGA